MNRILQKLPFPKRWLPVLQRYQTDRGLALNILYAVWKFAFGVYYRSVWFGTLAVYYLLLAVTRFSLVRHAGRNAFGTNIDSEWKRYRLCGVVLAVMTLALTGVVILVVQENEGFHYAGYLIYAMALYPFAVPLL